MTGISNITLVVGVIGLNDLITKIITCAPAIARVLLTASRARRGKSTGLATAHNPTTAESVNIPWEGGT